MFEAVIDMATSSCDFEKQLSDFELAPPGWKMLLDEPVAPPPQTIKPAPPCRFGKLIDNEVERAKTSAIPLRTLKDTKWCLNLWRDWSRQRDQNMSDIDLMSETTLQWWLCHFTLKIRKQNGAHYPPETLYHIVCGLLRHVRVKRPDVDFFGEFRMILDSEMKRLRKEGIHTKGKKAEPLTNEEEDSLWSKGILGDHSPQALLNTVFYQNGVNFALRSGSEHRQLRYQDCQIQAIERPGERPYLLYVEDSSKNNPGGLKCRKMKTKEVKQHCNDTNPTRCPVRLFKLYNQLCPELRPGGAFYLMPLQKPTEDCWFSSKPLGHNALNRMVQDMCKAAGITGFKTNHSLRATTATRLFQAGVDEQLIMERTGHRSIDGVRSYKRTSEQQRTALSDLLNLSAPETKRMNIAANHQATLTIEGCSNCTINVNYGQK